MSGVSLPKLLGQFVFLFVLLALPLFGAAGTLQWPAAGGFMGLFFGACIAITAWLWFANPELLKERMTVTRSDQKGWDKVLFAIVYVAFYTWLILIGLDAVRFGWSQLPIWLQAVGALGVLASFG